ncbi:hypothetical protein M2322_003188 [Rhodoblastus acidophilus]|uniref:hypothetical protein n=1 Tax=Rhodoblastus acidophilus TaxID=1074 RepID=UPI002224A68A|nr:hypothetical protein [Rhodoblastus acidophilus]MCW2317624.1 hypothetical protein [Rhodoblastus acidophilus]
MISQARVPDAPDNDQTVAVLRRCHVAEPEIVALLKHPLLGQFDLSVLLTEARSRMRATGEVTADDIEEVFGDFPAEPHNQREWLETALKATDAAAVLALTRHAAAFGEARECRMANER